MDNFDSKIDKIVAFTLYLGLVSTLFGAGTPGHIDTGPSGTTTSTSEDRSFRIRSVTDSSFCFPHGLSYDKTSQVLVVADTGNNVVRHIDVIKGWLTSFVVSFVAFAHLLFVFVFVISAMF